MKKSDIWMPIYIGDLLADTQHLTNEQFGTYHKVLYHQWRHGHFSEDELFAVAGFSGPVFESASSTSQAELKQGFSRVLAPIKQMLSRDDDGLWFQRRCDLEKEKWTHKKGVFVERARKGGIAKAKRIRELMAKDGDKTSASSSASSLLEGVLESCTSPSQIEEQKQKRPPTPFASRRGMQNGSSSAHASSIPNAPSIAAPSTTSAERWPAAPVTENVDKAKPVKQAAGAIADEANNGKPHQVGKNQLLPVPQSSAHASRNGSHPSKAEIRREGFEREVLQFWEAQNPEHPKYRFSGPDRRALGDLLRGQPDLSIEELRRLLRNRAASDINPAAAPHKWLRSIIEYSAGPLHKYGKPQRAARMV